MAIASPSWLLSTQQVEQKMEKCKHFREGFGQQADPSGIGIAIVLLEFHGARFRRRPVRKGSLECGKSARGAWAWDRGNVGPTLDLLQWPTAVRKGLLPPTNITRGTRLASNL
jgi:hypothetical protein